MPEFKFPASLTTSGGRTTVTAFNQQSSSPIFVADSNHPHWSAIIRGLETGSPEVWGLFDVATGVMSRFNEVTERISYDGSNVLFDGTIIHSALASQLARAIEDGEEGNYKALAKFWEKLESNPNEHSRTQAYDFLSCHNFQITSEGDLVGFKGVRESVENEEVTYLSSWASHLQGKPSAFVDGEPVPELSHVPQKIGSVVTMPREEVMHDPSVACSRGLHVATHDYAKSFGVVLEVHVNPRDIVSVPDDANGQKVRVWRYKVARAVNGSTPDYSTPVARETFGGWKNDVGYRG